MKMYIYALFNTLSGSAESVHLIKNDEMASVYLAPFAVNRAPLDEWKIYKVAEFDPDTLEVTPIPHTVVQFDPRRLKENYLDG